jgi:4-amino-4-deoxy-L-arabinose transferase-like glycosyltransferase
VTGLSVRLRDFQSAIGNPKSAIAIIFLVALALRLYCLDCKGLWYDEVASLEVAGRGLDAFLTDRFGWMSVQTPLHYLLVWLTSWPLDPAQSAIIVRLPSALAGALITLVVYGLGRELFGRAAGLLAGMCMALSAVHIGYSQDLRPYSLLVLCTVLSVYCLVVAERTGERRWWLAFILASLANLYLSYFALTLVLPALAPYLLWIIYHARAGRTGRYALSSFLVVALGSIPLLLDLASVPRNVPDWTLLTPSLVATQYNRALTQLTKIGTGDLLEIALQWLFFLLAMSGLAFGIRDRRWSGVILCVAFLIVPSLLIALFRTNNTVFQRYILFTLPFYLLLVANGLVSMWRIFAAAKVLRKSLNEDVRAGPRARLGGLPDLNKAPLPERAGTGTRPYETNAALLVARMAVAGFLLVPFAYSAWVYFDAAQYRVFNTQPDYQGVAQYLRSVARPDDLIILADEPALASTVLDYYWHTSSPASFYDARDPRLPATSKGSIYLVVSFFQNDPSFLQRLSAPGNGWPDARHFERVAVLRAPPGDVSASLERFTSIVGAENPRFQPVLTMRASLSQLRGAVATAATTYASAGEYFGTGEEYLRTAEGYLQRGDRARAWREALISKFMRPGSPALHAWLAARLIEENRPDLGSIEQQIARLLTSDE